MQTTTHTQSVVNFDDANKQSAATISPQGIKLNSLEIKIFIVFVTETEFVVHKMLQILIQIQHK